MVELLIVVGIIVVVSAISLPTVTRSIRTYRLNGTAANVASSLQLARLSAVRMNRTNPPVAWRNLVIGGQNVVWVDLNSNGGPDATEPQYNFPSEIQLNPGGAPSLASMGYATTQVGAAAVAFDPRGAVNFGAGAPTVYVFVFGYANQPQQGFTAVSVMPTGKTQQWRAATNGPWQKR
jgi:type II secretory pathway pseudopilin PulG